MKQFDPLELAVSGTLTRPGPIGRLARFVFGVMCAYALAEIVSFAATGAALPISTLNTRFTLMLPPLCIFNYVVNIGFARNWGHRPLLASLSVLLIAGAGALLVSGTLDSLVLGIPLTFWLVYFYAHLGASFLLSAVIATPGCEMRAIPELVGRIRGRPTREHHCPVAFIAKIDEWEQGRASGISS